MTKAEARKYFRERRKLLTHEAYQLANQMVYEQVTAFLAPLKPKSVHCYLPILKNKEVNTWPIVEWLNKQAIRVVVPRSSVNDNTMQHYQLVQGVKCDENAWGIPEPKTDSLIPVSEQTIDVVLVPLLAFDQQGHRVGYGKGYYDVFLSKCLPDTLKIGLSFFPPIPEITGVNHLDIRLTHAITPDRLWNFTDSRH
ncbi:5-formyltetrahydrofolate cyclo-ligase [Catalinimonas niigatensis]|uniref:5-formyltetrahydrofolate cyclo-ligase n=1 Tax=Catalinimonas niigatensis TaxID=1397264 RepID=UPI00266613A5|nr:5-formyltetrahydrofolate cyclo-ligase [Catalinimonas niigatensis]WPP47950.1 5-formyltetrahydrofolate cyclo-ligase [Catalinimonas niigatensis]